MQTHSVARNECASVSRENMRLIPSTGLSRSNFAVTASAPRPPFCRTLPSVPARAAAPMGRSATPGINASAAGAGPDVHAPSALHAAPPNAGAIATSVNPPAAKERFAANSLERATFPSRFALAMRWGVASKGFSESSLRLGPRNVEQRRGRVLGDQRHRNCGRDERGGECQRKGEREAAETRNDARKRSKRDLHDKC